MTCATGGYCAACSSRSDVRTTIENESSPNPLDAIGHQGPLIDQALAEVAEFNAQRTSEIRPVERVEDANDVDRTCSITN